MLGFIKAIVHQFKDQKILLQALYNAKANLYSLQQENLSNDDYLRKFNSLVNVAVSYNGQVHNNTIHDIVTATEHGDTRNYNDLQDDEKAKVNKISSQNVLCNHIPCPVRQEEIQKAP